MQVKIFSAKSFEEYAYFSFFHDIKQEILIFIHIVSFILWSASTGCRHLSFPISTKSAKTVRSQFETKLIIVFFSPLCWRIKSRKKWNKKNVVVIFLFIFLLFIYLFWTFTHVILLSTQRTFMDSSVIRRNFYSSPSVFFWRHFPRFPFKTRSLGHQNRIAQCAAIYQ